MNALGVEIAKNIVLSGVNRLVIFDRELVTAQDLSGQFFLSESDIGKSRAQACVS